MASSTEKLIGAVTRRYCVIRDFACWHHGRRMERHSHRARPQGGYLEVWEHRRIWRPGVAESGPCYTAKINVNRRQSRPCQNGYCIGGKLVGRRLMYVTSASTLDADAVTYHMQTRKAAETCQHQSASKLSSRRSYLLTALLDAHWFHPLQAPHFVRHTCCIYALLPHC